METNSILIHIGNRFDIIFRKKRIRKHKKIIKKKIIIYIPPIIIEPKPKKKCGRPRTKKSYSAEFRRVSKPLRTSCSDCGATTLLQIHHKDFNKENNDLSNLVCLCYYCHSKFHPHMQNKNPPKWLK